jgi:hypothetical protein
MAAVDIIDQSRLYEAINNLAKTIEKSNEKMVKAISKITGGTIKNEEDKVNQTSTAIQDEETVQRKRGKVFEDVINVNIVELGGKAVDQLNKILKSLVPKEEKKKEEMKKPEESSFLKKLLALAPLLLPILAAVLKFLAGLSGDKLFEFLANLFPKIFDIGKLADGVMDLLRAFGNLVKEGFILFKETKLGKFFSELGDDIAKLFKENKLFQKLFGEAGIFSKVFGKAGFFAKLFGEGSTFAKIFDTAGDAAKVLTGGFFGKIFKGVGKTVLKRLPLLGSIFSFYDAYNELSSGDYLSGFTSLLSGIANLFPGVGSVISIGLDFLNYLFKTESMQDFKANLNQGLFTQAFSSLGDTLVQKVPFLKWFYDLSENIGGALAGDTESIIKLFDQFGLGALGKWMFGDTMMDKAEAYADASFFEKLIIEGIVKPITSLIEWFNSMFGNLIESAKEKVKGFFGFGKDKEQDYDPKAEQQRLEENLKAKKAQKLKEQEMMLKQQKEQGYEQLNDFTSEPENIIKRGDVIKKFSKDDAIMGFKPGGDIDKTLKSIVKFLGDTADNGKALVDTGKKQIELMQALLDKNSSNLINNSTSNNTYVLNSRSSVSTFREEALRY